MSECRESAVGALLRAAGMEPRSRKGDLDTIGLREAERRSGVSRQTFSIWLSDVGPEGRRYDKTTLDRVATALGIDRRKLGVAAMQDSGVVLPSDAVDVYEYLIDRDDKEKRQILAWLATEVARQDAGSAE